MSTPTWVLPQVTHLTQTGSVLKNLPLTAGFLICTKPKADDQPTANLESFKGVRSIVENNDVAGLMAELDKVPTDTTEAIMNKLSITDGNGGRIELDGNQMVPMPENIRKQAEEQLKKKRQLENGDAT